MKTRLLSTIICSVCFWMGALAQNDPTADQWEDNGGHVGLNSSFGANDNIAVYGGTATPAAKMHIASANGYDNWLRIDRWYGKKAFEFVGEYSYPVMKIYNHDGVNVKVQLHPDQDGWIDNVKGRFGIGTTTPSYKLDVASNTGYLDGKLLRLSKYVGLPMLTVEDDYGHPMLTMFNSNGTTEDVKIHTEEDGWINNIKGRFGIGTTAPAYKLDVASNTGYLDGKLLRLSKYVGLPMLTVEDDYGHPMLTMFHSNGTTEDVKIHTQGDSWLNGGNLGIGDATPGNKLEITQGYSGNSGLRFTNLTSASSTVSNPGNGVLALDADGDVIYVDEPSGGGSGGTIIADAIQSSGGGYVEVADLNVTSELKVGTNSIHVASMSVGLGVEDHIYVPNDGLILQANYLSSENVGIGEVNPLAKLHVNGDVFNEGRSRLGNSNDYMEIDGIGKMYFNGNGYYKIDDDQYVFNSSFAQEK